MRHLIYNSISTLRVLSTLLLQHCGYYDVPCDNTHSPTVDCGRSEHAVDIAIQEVLKTGQVSQQTIDEARPFLTVVYFPDKIPCGGRETLGCTRGASWIGVATTHYAKDCWYTTLSHEISHWALTNQFGDADLEHTNKAFFGDGELNADTLGAARIQKEVCTQ